MTRILPFLRKPWHQKTLSLEVRFKRLWHRVLPSAPLPVRLSFGAWWLCRNDACGDAVFLYGYEDAERRFVQHLLREQMTVIDAGAHQGFYTMLASKRVGRSGRVYAFEPSPRQQRWLRLHLKLNRCDNVTVESFALADGQGESTLFEALGRDTGCSSLRQPVVEDPVRPVPVQTITLDRYLELRSIPRVDFVKLDVEGAELAVLKGADRLLQQPRRPVFLIETQDLRTRTWGYSTSAIYDFLAARAYRWFCVQTDGALAPCPRARHHQYGNLVAGPAERLNELAPLIHPAAPRTSPREGMPPC